MYMKVFSLKDTVENPALFSPWSFQHFIVGFAAYVIIKAVAPELSLTAIVIIGFIVHTVYELKDILCYDKELFRKIFRSGPLKNRPDLNNSIANSVGDTIMAFFGCVLAPYIVTKPTVYGGISLVASCVVTWILMIVAFPNYG